jgi:FkbM family methyltransferase
MTRFLESVFSKAVTFVHRRRFRGVSKIFTLLGRFLHCEPLIVVEARGQIRLALSPRYYIDTEVIRTGYYEPEILETLLDRLREGDLFWDVGANFGLHSVAVAKLRPDCRVVAFEPNPAMVSRILINSELNGAGIAVVQGGIWESTSIVRFVNENEFNPGGAYLCAGGEQSRNRASLDILCHSGDYYTANLGIGTPDVIKIDTEGAEWKILHGLRSVLQQGSPHTIVYEERKEDAVNSHDSISQLLTLHGFTIEPIGEASLGEHANWVGKREPRRAEMSCAD